MMSPISSPRTSLTPEVVFDPELCRLRVLGECYPEDPTVFFLPLIGALRAVEPEARSSAKLEAVFRLSYVNSASTVWFRRIVSLLDQLAERGVTVRLTWEYDADDDASRELGQDLTEGLHHLEVIEQATTDAA